MYCLRLCEVSILPQVFSGTGQPEIAIDLERIEKLRRDFSEILSLPLILPKQVLLSLGIQAAVTTSHLMEVVVRANEPRPVEVFDKVNSHNPSICTCPDCDTHSRGRHAIVATEEALRPEFKLRSLNVESVFEKLREPRSEPNPMLICMSRHVTRRTAPLRLPTIPSKSWPTAIDEQAMPAAMQALNMNVDVQPHTTVDITSVYGMDDKSFPFATPIKAMPVRVQAQATPAATYNSSEDAYAEMAAMPDWVTGAAFQTPPLADAMLMDLDFPTIRLMGAPEPSTDTNDGHTTVYGSRCAATSHVSFANEEDVSSVLSNNSADYDNESYIEKKSTASPLVQDLHYSIASSDGPLPSADHLLDEPAPGMRHPQHPSLDRSHLPDSPSKCQASIRLPNSLLRISDSAYDDCAAMWPEEEETLELPTHRRPSPLAVGSTNEPAGHARKSGIAPYHERGGLVHARQRRGGGKKKKGAQVGALALWAHIVRNNTRAYRLGAQSRGNKKKTFDMHRKRHGAA